MTGQTWRKNGFRPLLLLDLDESGKEKLREQQGGGDKRGVQGTTLPAELRPRRRAMKRHNLFDHDQLSLNPLKAKTGLVPKVVSYLGAPMTSSIDSDGELIQQHLK